MKIAILIVALIILCFRLYYTIFIKPFRVEHYEKITKSDIITKHNKKSNMLIYHYGNIKLQNKIFQKNIVQYSKKYGFDYINQTHNNSLNIWKNIYTIFTELNYEYILIIPSNLYVHDMSKNIMTLLEQAGDSEMIMCRDENNKNMVNMEVIIFKNSVWTLYKLHQLYYDYDKNENIVLDQIYVNYQQQTLQEFKEYLNIGIPYKLTNICVYNEHSLVSSYSTFLRYIITNKNKRKLIYPWIDLNHGKFTTIKYNAQLSDLTPYTKNRIIPKLIFQTMESNLMLLNVKQCIEQVKELNKTYKYFYFTSYDSRQFILKNFPKNVLEAYDTLIPGAYKSDLWRYCVLYKYGGFYLDSRMLPYIPFDSIINKDTEFVSCIDIHSNMLYQAILGAKPNSEFLKVAIDMCVDNILNKSNNVGDLGVTGPKVIGMAVNKVLNRTVHEDLKTIVNPKMVLLNWTSEKIHKYLEISNTIFACHKYTKLLNDDELTEENKYWTMLSGKEHYSTMYKNNKIYKYDLFT